MRTTETVLNVLSERGKHNQPVERLYRQLYSVNLYKVAYAQIYANRGATTRGVDEDTLDGTSTATFERIIERVKSGTYEWKPVRRTEIPKKDGRKRPLGIPTASDKLLQTAMKILLEAYYEPQFSEQSHGFRPGRGCHTALTSIGVMFKGTKWFIEGDIKGCFDNIDHKILLEMLAEDIKDSRFLKLLKGLLKAGWMEGETHYNTYSGTPQGGTISPLLANIYLHKFDKWVENELLPRYNHSQKGDGRRRKNPEYKRLSSAIERAKKKGDSKTAKMLRTRRNTVPSLMVNDPDYRKLEYIRYADDFILGFAGPKKEAEEIKEDISEFLKETLNLEMSGEKTLITHARTEKARFLGYDLLTSHTPHRRKANGNIWFGVPREVVNENVHKYLHKGKISHRRDMLNLDDYTIIAEFQAIYRGLVNYYCMAHNIDKLSKVNWVSQASLLKTLANKHKTSVNKIGSKHKSTRHVNGRTYKVIQAFKKNKRTGKTYISHYGAIPLKRNPKPTKISDNVWITYGKEREINRRMDAEFCEMCGNKGPVEMHHRNPMRNVHKKGKKSLPAAEVKMIAMNRKTLAVCWPCHKAMHKREHRPEWDAYKKQLTQHSETENAG